MHGRDARRRAGGDDIAGLERHALRDEGNQRGNVEQHRRGAAVLQPPAVDVQADGDAVRVGQFVGSDEPRPERRRGGQVLAANEVAAVLLDEAAAADVVVQRVAGDTAHRLGAAHAQRAPADHDRQFSFIADVADIGRDQDRLAGADHGAA